ncbi:MAG TPA: RNB domain-containing ribonuclease, partial [Syntrophales bacterium]
MNEMNQNRSGRHLEILRRIARRAMIERGFLPDFSARVNSELAGLKADPVPSSGSVRDLRDLPWCSIDNDESRDLDQLTVVREGAKEAVTILVAIADVDTVVRKGRAIDD